MIVVARQNRRVLIIVKNDRIIRAAATLRHDENVADQLERTITDFLGEIGQRGKGARGERLREASIESFLKLL